MSWKKIKLGDILKQYRIEHRVDDKTTYKQVSILNDGSVVLRGEKIGKEIGRKRQFVIDTKKYPNTLIFTRQLLLQGSIGIASDDVHNCIVTENMPMFSIDISKIDREFLILFVKSKVFKTRISEIELSGSAQKSIHEKTFLNLEFFLPPFELQKEIVVDLLKLKGGFDAISTELTLQLTLVKKLRQQLLQDAVQGKLVEQNKKDEPASELLKKIKAEKEKLIAEKKLKKEKELPPIKPSDIPFEIPENWVWCRLGDVVLFLNGYAFKSEWFKSEGIPLLRNINLGINELNWNETVKLPHSKAEEFENYLLNVGDIILSLDRPIINAGLKIAQIKSEDMPCLLLQRVLKVTPFFIDDNYLYKWFNSRLFIDSINPGRSIGIPHISHNDVAKVLIPIPPLNEQKLIGEKLDELMQFCNELEASIKQSESQNSTLLQQVLREALRKEPVEA